MLQILRKKDETITELQLQLEELQAKRDLDQETLAKLNDSLNSQRGPRNQHTIELAAENERLTILLQESKEHIKSLEQIILNSNNNNNNKSNNSSSSSDESLQLAMPMESSSEYIQRLIVANKEILSLKQENTSLQAHVEVLDVFKFMIY